MSSTFRRFTQRQDRAGYRSLIQQAREQGRYEEVMALMKNDPKAFGMMVLEFRTKSTAESKVDM